jgi:serine/threonine protein kinase
MAHAVGTILAGRYEVLGFLGSGGYGEVYRVRDHHLDVTVALKLMRRFAGTNAWAEAQRLMELESDYILKVLNADLDAGVPFLVTKLADSGSADGPMQPIGVPPERAVRWVRHACRGAARTHASRLLHRDIKPHNLFLTTSDEALLGDFGIAVFMDANGEGRPLGTPVTTAPEVAGGHNTTVASDVYSLGATLYALLSGQFSNEIGDPPLRDVAPHISIALAQRVQTAMAPNPGDRFATADDFDAALGTLPPVNRRWRRTDEHLGHDCCFRGTARGKADATVCVLRSGKRWEVLAQHQPTGRRINAACRAPAPESAIARNLRAAIASVP